MEFDSDGSNAISFLWSFGDATSSTLADPVHFYTSYGNYTVKLQVNGAGCGNDTIEKIAYIRVDSSLNCSYFIGSDRISNDCEANLYDIGGLNGNYELDSKDTFEIAPASGDQIVLFIDELMMEAGDQNFCNRDFLEIYDGDLSSPIIGKYCSNNLPPDSIVSTSNRLTLVFNSDNANVDGGIRARWKCISATTVANADFYTPLDTLCTGLVNFTDLSTGGATSWSWDFGDGVSTNEKNPSHFYENDGTYTVRLIVGNSIGFDTITKTNAVTIQRLSAPTVSNDTACLGGRVKLGASGNGILQWFLSPSSQQSFFGGDTLRLNNLTSDNSYYVQYEQKPNAIIGSPFTISGSGYYTDTAEAMYFDVFEPMILESVIFNSNRGGERRIELRNSAGQLIQSKTVWIPAVATQANIGFTIYPDTAYSLTIGSSNPSLYVNATGASYPYTMGNVMELTGSSMGSNAYPFFYYWIARPLSCYSSRARVEAKVDSTCGVVGTDDLADLNREFRLFPNPSSEGFRISGLNQNDRNIILEIYSIDGKMVKRDRFAQASDLMNQELGEGLQAAVYFVRLSMNGDERQFKWIKTQ